MFFLGIDVGSITTKAVLIDHEKKILSAHIVSTGAQIKNAITDVCRHVLEPEGVDLDAVSYVVSTGYGRKNVACAAKQVTEITAHAWGARFFFPHTRLVIDIGGQDTKATVLTETGEVQDFVMNDKCAAGTGRFLEVMAGILNMPLAAFGEQALAHNKKVKITSTCTVFAESEVISLIARQEAVNDIAFAIHDSVVDRIVSLARKMPIRGEITLSGGVSKNAAIRAILTNRLATNVNVAPDPQLLGALGTAVLAQKYSHAS